MGPNSNFPGLIPYQTDQPPQPNTSPLLLGVQLRPHTPSTLSDGPKLSPHQARDTRERMRRSYSREDSNNQEIPNIEAPIKNDKWTRWPRGSDFLGSTCAFTLSLHSLWSLPVLVVQHGGVTFLLIYIVSVVILGAPLLILEMSLGQYSSIAPAQLPYHLCPLLAGLGVAVCVQAAVRALLDMAVIMWAGQALYRLLADRHIKDGFFYRDVLNREDSSLEELGQLLGELCLILAISCVVIFILIAAGTRSVGKVCLVAVPACFMLLVTLTIRTCLATGGPAGVMILLTPDWAVLTQPLVWLEAAGQVIFSLQLGMGAVSAYSSYNTYQHNIVRDCAIITISHLLWVILAILLSFSLLGVAHNTAAINLINLVSDPALVSITGHGLWLATITLIETAMATISTGWLWATLFFILIFLVSITSVFGYLEVITSSLVNRRPAIVPFKPALTFGVVVLLFLLDLLLATQGGINVYHLLFTYLSSWPPLLFSLLLVLATVICHGAGYLMKDISYMSKINLPHWATSHLSVIYITVLPVFLTASLSWSLYSLALEHQEEPLSTFSMTVPPFLREPLAWCLVILPPAPIIAGAVMCLLCGLKVSSVSRNLRNYFAPTNVWHSKAQLEMAESDV